MMSWQPWKAGCQIPLQFMEVDDEINIHFPKSFLLSLVKIKNEQDHKRHIKRKNPYSGWCYGYYDSEI